MENDLLANIQERWNNTGSPFWICYWLLEEAAIYQDEISDFILEEMSDVFNCDLEDGSNDEVLVFYCFHVDCWNYPVLLQ